MTYRPLTEFEFLFRLCVVVHGERPHMFWPDSVLFWNNVTSEITVCSRGVVPLTTTIMVRADLDFWGVQEALMIDADFLEVLRDLVFELPIEDFESGADTDAD